MSLLSFAPAFHVLLNLLQEGGLSQSCNFSQTVQDLASWAHNRSSDSSVLSSGVVAKLDLLTHEMGSQHGKRRQSNASHDTGYGSLGETEVI
jgi:hypothetical protein